MVKNEFFKRTILDWAIFVLLIQVFATSVIALDPGKKLRYFVPIYSSQGTHISTVEQTIFHPDFVWPKVFGVVFGVFVFYSIAGLLSSKKLIRFGILAFLGAGPIISIIGLVDMAWRPIIYFNKIISNISEKIPKIGLNLPGTERGINANALAGILILIFPLCFIFFTSHVKRKKGNYLTSSKLINLIFFYLTLLVMGSLLFLTQSKGAWIGLIVSIWILFLSWKSKKRSILLILLLVIFVLSLNLIKPASIIDEIKEDISLRTRWWIVGVQTVNDHPLWGIGLNCMRTLPEIDSTHVHNHLLNTAAELGIPALVAYLAILIGSGYMCYQIWDKSNIKWMKLAAQGLACGQLAHFIFGIGDSISLGAKPGMIFWYSLGLITAIHSYTIKEAQKHTQKK